MKNITELLSEVAYREAVSQEQQVDHAIFDQPWFKSYTKCLVDLAAEHCANHVRNMPSRGGFKFAERASYINQEDAVELIKGVFKQ